MGFPFIRDFPLFGTGLDFGIHNPGGTTCLTLLVERWFSSKVANNAATDGAPRHDNQRIKQMRPHYTSSVRRVLPPKQPQVFGAGVDFGTDDALQRVFYSWDLTEGFFTGSDRGILNYWGLTEPLCRTPQNEARHSQEGSLRESKVDLKRYAPNGD